MRVKQQLVGLSPYKPGKPIDEVKKEFGLNEVIKLASNENPFGCSKFAREAIANVLDQLAIYPDGYAANIRTEVANFLHVDERQLIFGNGSDEIILILCRALLTPGTNTVCAVPSFPQYKHNAVIEGAEVREVPLVNGVHDLNAMLAQIDADTKIVWVCNPNNPSGTYTDAESFQEFMAKVPKDVLVVSDEAYYEYVVAEDYPSTLPLLSQYDNLMVLRTFSKAYGLASLRIGYGVGNADFIQTIEPAREPFNTSLLAQVAASAALKDQEFITHCKEQNRGGLEQYYRFCKEHNLDYYPSQGNFILIDLQRSGNDVFNYLVSKGFIVRSGEALGFPTSVRITVGNTEQNDAIINELKQYLNS
ncbi:histidinol-phosphate transaminase [Anaerobacillus alkaliphilus]|uniref:Histidinol-phosphate aminotransferase n=1 Tax=Anaerobacillus alkaliphilus TaxID=1548597 RepID=A0A4Q0VW69_9BACI|nr:histidinol-phosphate transaminase [Anaerobacillus alkaliphilus]RXJ03957.1 histidinol-phosphate transaminase [Anaerobacillus alkaliphilus]